MFHSTKRKQNKPTKLLFHVLYFPFSTKLFFERASQNRLHRGFAGTANASLVKGNFGCLARWQDLGEGGCLILGGFGKPDLAVKKMPPLGTCEVLRDIFPFPHQGFLLMFGL